MRADQVIDSLGPGVTSPYAIKVTSADEELPALEEDWNRLSEASEHPNVFMTYGWFSAWSRRLQETPGRVRPHVLVLKEGNSVVGIAPLIRRKLSPFGFPVRKLEFATIHSDYNDVVVGGDNAGLTAAVVDFLARTADQWEFLDLRNLRDSGNSIAYIENTLLSAGLHYRLFPEAERCPYMPITGPWSEMAKEHSRFMRRILRRCEDMAAEGLRMRIVEDPQKEPELLQKLVALDSREYVGGQPSFPLLRTHQDVFQAIFNTLGPKNWILVVLLEKNDTPIACHLLYRCGKKLWGSFTAYDQNYASLSPGTALIPAIVDYGYERGFDEFDFLRGEEMYKARWTKGTRSNCRLIIWNHRLRSRMSAFAFLKRRGLPVNVRAGQTLAGFAS